MTVHRAPSPLIRAAEAADHDAIWRIFEPIVRAGETYPLAHDLGKADALGYWLSPAHRVFVAERAEAVVGSYYLRANNQGGGAHVANCGYIVAADATRCGIAHAMCMHSLEQARAQGFRAMQFNFVIASNARAVRLWQRCGFQIVGRLPDAFQHPQLGVVDALVMFRKL